MTVYSRFNRPERMHTEAGRKFKNEYEIKIDEDGHKRVHKSGETNLYERIQEALPDTLIINILDRAAMGDPEALARHQENYLDATDMPKTLAEAQNTIIRIQNEFEDLPAEVRKKFDFSAEKYVAEYGTESWLSNMGYEIKNGKPEIKEPEAVIESGKEPVEIGGTAKNE